MTSRHLVLAGAGHAHILVLNEFARRSRPDCLITLITKTASTPYSGRVPGCVEGRYSWDAVHIDAARLARACGAALIEAEIIGFDAARRHVLLNDRPPVSYDFLSIDIGITPDPSGIRHVERAIAVKPIGDFLRQWDDLRHRAILRRIAIVGGGAAGVELAFAVAVRLRADANGADISVTLVAADEVMGQANAWVRKAVLRALEAKRIVLIEARIVAVETDHIVTADGRNIDADAVLLSTDAAAPSAFRESGFALDKKGFLSLRPTLQVLNDDHVFGAGDCASVIAHPRPKAGVFAVRQGPVLSENLRRIVQGRNLKPFVPQKTWLSLIGTADGRAIGGRGAWLKIEGRWVWMLKSAIDERFMRQFH